MKKLSKPLKAIKSSAQILLDWEKALSLDIRSRLKEMKSIVYDVCEAYKTKTWDLKELEVYINILRQIHRIHPIPRLNLYLSKMTHDWLTLTGASETKILAKKSGVIHTETASIAMGDPCYLKEIEDAYRDYNEKKVIDLINAGKTYLFNTGGDGSYNVQLRWVEAKEPVLTHKEFKYVISATDAFVIHVPTGIIASADPIFLDQQDNRIALQVPPGYYRVCIYFFCIPTKVESFYIYSFYLKLLVFKFDILAIIPT